MLQSDMLSTHAGLIAPVLPLCQQVKPRQWAYFGYFPRSRASFPGISPAHGLSFPFLVVHREISCFPGLKGFISQTRCRCSSGSATRRLGLSSLCSMVLRGCPRRSTLSELIAPFGWFGRQV